MFATTRTSSALAIVVALAVLAGPIARGRRRAEAQPNAFDEAYQKGQDLFHLGRYDEARTAFMRARNLAPRLPGPHRWLGRTARVLEKWDECVASSTEAVRLKPDTRLLSQVSADLDACRAALGRPPYPTRLAVGQGALAVLSDVGEGRVVVDGIDRGPLPVAPFALNAGRHAVRVLLSESSLHDGAPTKPIEDTIDVVPGIVVDALLLTGRAPER